MYKKYAYALSAALILVIIAAVPSFAVKPEGNLAGSLEVGWNLSADVMPVPPYGSRDIPGSDTASKLIVNQPNGSVEAVLTGVMNGLHPNTTYTVYLSKGYTPYTRSIDSNWVWSVLGTYLHDVTITQQNADGTFSGTAGWPSGAPPYLTTEVITGQIVGNTFTMTTTYNGPYNTGYTATATGTIQADGSIVGTSPWSWSALAGTINTSGSTGWPGLFTSTIPPFTFTTDENGSGSWHLNLRDSHFSGPATYILSVWINEAGGTMLISNTFEVTVD